jgi:glycosyltransferase involved in cell wall biosynthesis
VKVLFVIPYPLNQAPSQRFRFEQYIEFLNQNGINTDFAPFLNFNTWKIFYKPGATFQKTLGIINGFIKRFLLIFKLHKYNFIFIHREACPVGPAFFEFLFARIFKKNIIFDFDDAIWLHDVSDANGKMGWLKKPQKTAKIIHYSKLITAGNNYLADYAKKHNQNVMIIPTTINTDYHNSKKTNNNQIIIGWTGTSTTIKHFELSFNVLLKIIEKYGKKIKIRLISNQPVEHAPFEIEFIPWNKETEIEDLSQLDIGIMPLPEDKWANGKCGFKGLQYMALKIPTIMSPVGVNCEIIKDGDNGYLAQTDEEWFNKICSLIDSETLRVKMGENGRKTVLERYSVEAQKKQYLKAFQSL